jgi:hypothetical protein
MKRTDLLDHLSVAKRDAEECEIHIAAQKRVIAELFDIGCDTADAERVLLLFETAQQDHLDHIDRILNLLDKIPLIESEAQS